ncbi:16S rRNA (guanine(966)-N(2))-methyltransferase RsmD [Mycoplasma sp. Pen4]|uniref:16S rRNA (guanine(966)-N(2))-methyltransferase RsmD n=1 Tax=Mycoplasma sp. Pen4 TaxID=640330 RepID=UPI00165432DE|nr:16S rRNA (guanine(966)-N(2))-methyltransferase RsmD [Mycoplasma sp. Pen4]QNM93745.1 16S rRNA (guanine(966)-N(2))-methyltransferase RsmD [Mycoplasma sp. Pen4]
MIRIIAGELRGLQIEQPSDKFTRPTTDRVREAVFSSIQFKVVDTNCLDLFTGSAAWAIESISRGAKSVDAIELNREVFEVAKKNILKTKTQDKINLIKADALDFVSRTSQKYDFVYIDAPYREYELVNKILSELAQRDILEEGFEIIIETDDPRELVIPDKFTEFKNKKYGKIHILYLCQN